MIDQVLVGCVGVIIVATRGAAGPGEASLMVRGGSESYLAWSGEPLSRGTQVVVTDSRGPRAVEVESLDELARTNEPPPGDLTL